MQHTYTIEIITAFSLLVQFASVVLALKLIKITGRRKAWTLISVSIFLMAIRRSITLCQMFSGDPIQPSDLAFETVGLATSVFMLLGIIFIAPIFKAMAENIKDLQDAHGKIRENEKRLDDITSSVAEGIYVSNAAGKITFMNPAAEALLGWKADELNKGMPHDIIHSLRNDGSHLPHSECRMHNVLNTGDIYTSDDEIFIKKDGTALPISVISSPIRENGKVVASVTTFRDITRQKQLEKDRETLILELQEALSTIKTLQGILPICSFCKKIRDDKGYWNQLEEYLSQHSEVLFTHSVCRECAQKHYPAIRKDGDS